MSENDVFKALALAFASTEELWGWHRRAVARRRQRTIVEWQGIPFAISAGEPCNEIRRRAERAAAAAASQQRLQLVDQPQTLF